MKRCDSVRGFSLVELIISVAIVCLLGEVIIPHFMNQTTRARLVAISSLSTALNTSIFYVVKKYHAAGLPMNTSVNINGNSVQVAPRTGFPLGNASGIGAVLKTINGFTSTYNETTQYDLVPAVLNCHVTYNSSSGQVLLDTKGC